MASARTIVLSRSISLAVSRPREIAVPPPGRYEAITASMRPLSDVSACETRDELENSTMLTRVQLSPRANWSMRAVIKLRTAPWYGLMLPLLSMIKTISMRMWHAGWRGGAGGYVLRSQSVQSLPAPQKAYSAPGPPSSQSPSSAYRQLSSHRGGNGGNGGGVGRGGNGGGGDGDGGGGGVGGGGDGDGGGGGGDRIGGNGRGGNGWNERLEQSAQSVA